MSPNDVAVDDPDARALRSALVDQLIRGGDLADPSWLAVFRAVPRHPFTPVFFVEHPDGWRVLSGGRDRAAWLGHVYADEPLVTQLDGHLNAEQADADAIGLSGVPSCSSSQPSLMALMLEHLRVEDGMRVLEIGTGTGYNAALLTERLGAANVISLEYDVPLLEQARGRLAACGYTPELLAGDGAAGHAASAPYNRLVATCGFPTVPPAWLEQVTPGGTILVNLYRPLGGGALAVLHVDDPQRASARLAQQWGGFMPTRTHHDRQALHLFDQIDHREQPRRVSTLAADAFDDDGFRCFAALTVLAHELVLHPAESPPQTWLLADDGSYACQTIGPDGTSTVVEDGPQQLWTALETAHQTWAELGKPPREALGLTVTPDQHTLWCHHPDVWSTPLPTGRPTDELDPSRR